MSNSNNNTNSQRLTSYRAVIPFYILYDQDMTANHLRLYCQIEQMENNGHPDVRPTFSFRWFANQIGVTRRHAMRIANELVAKGYIKHLELVDGGWVWTTSNFVREDPKKPVDSNQSIRSISCDKNRSIKAIKPLKPNESVGSTGESTGDVGGHPPGDVGGHPKIPKEINKRKDLRSIVDSKKSTKDKAYLFDALFMLFYLHYPLKEKPRVAYQAFLKHNPSEEFVEMLLNDLKLRMENNWKGRESRFLPHPATYLNQAHWESEIVPWQESTNKPKSHMTAEYVYSTRIFREPLDIEDPTPVWDGEVVSEE